MKKNLLYTALGLMGLMGTLAIGVVNAETTITHYTGSNISYTLNGNELFTGVGTITITDGINTITILDRNLGANKAGTGCDYKTNGNQYCAYDDTFGYHFQRGNNYGFKPGCNLQGSTYYCSDTITSGAVNGQVDATTISYNPASQEFYNSGVFYKGYSNWLTDNSKVDLWGGSTGGTDTITSTSSLNGDNWKVDESTVKNRRGPCPENFHVPSYGEIEKLQSMLESDGKRNTGTLHNELLIPFAGGRGYGAASVFGMGRYAYLWSSSPYSDSNPPSRYLYLSENGFLYMSYNDYRANAFSVRCFYDSYQPFTQTFSISFTGAEGGSISIGSIKAEEGNSITINTGAGTVQIGDIIVTATPEEGYAFSGWLTDCDGDTVTTGCSFTGVFKLIPYTITYLGTGDDYIPSATGFTIKSNDITLENPTKIGYTFTGRSGTNIEGITGTVTIPTGSTGDRIYEANWEANEYTITIDIDGNETILTGKYGEPVTRPADPTKNGYKFIGWEPEFPATMPLSGATVKAKWEKLGSSGGGGGGSSKSSSNSEKSTEGQAGNQQPLSPQQASDSSPNREQTVTPMIGGDGEARGGSTQTYTQEFQEAYEFAHEKGITTMPTIQEAQMDGKLTRIAMAKMLSQYAINVLGMAPDITQNNKFNDVTEKMDSDYDDGVTLAYQLGIMGINMPNNKFRPNDEVTRGEFVTALSRMLYNTSDGEYRSTPKYYTHHMEKMEGEGIITNTNPNMKELRGYVMIMLMRSVK